MIPSEAHAGLRIAYAASQSPVLVRLALFGSAEGGLQPSSKRPRVVLMLGLQGAGKTTTSGKLAKWLAKGGHRPLLVSVDVYRPAARDQLKVIAKDIGVRLWEGNPNDKCFGTHQ